MSRLLVITQENFDELLAWLDPDRERAGLKYEDLRRSLIRIFVWRGCTDAEELADETINRVTTKVRQVRPTYQGDPSLYFYGVAKYLIREEQNKRKKLPVQIEALTTTISNPVVERAEDENLELEYECFCACLQKLDQATRELILAYYLEEKQAKIDHRKELAKELGLVPNALRVRMRRIRAKLEECIENCVEQMLPGEMD